MPDATYHWSGFASANYVSEALFSVTNSSTKRNRVIQVERFDLMPMSPGNLENIVPLHLRRVSGISTGGGSSVDLVASVPSNTPHAAIRCEIQTPVTVASDAPIRSMLLLGQNTGQLSSNGFGNIMPPGDASGPSSPGRWGTFANFGRDAEAQGIIIREDQGVAIMPANVVSGSAVPRGQVFWLDFLFTDDLGNAYAGVCDLVSSGVPGASAWVLWNGSGSGRVLTLRQAQYSISGYSNDNGNVSRKARVKFCVTRGENTGELMTPITAVPDASVHSGLEIRRGRLGKRLVLNRDMDAPVSNFLGLDNGQFSGPGTTPPWGDDRRFVSVIRSVNPYRFGAGLPGGLLFNVPAAAERYGNRHRSASTQTIIVPPGFGFAAAVDCLVYGGIATSIDSPNTWHAYWVDLVVTVKDVALPVARAFA